LLNYLNTGQQILAASESKTTSVKESPATKIKASFSISNSDQKKFLTNNESKLSNTDKMD